MPVRKKTKIRVVNRKNKKRKPKNMLLLKKEPGNLAVAAPGKPKRINYVNNETLLAELIQYKTELAKHTKSPLKYPKPRVSEYIGATILKIAERLSSKPNFSGYSYRDEMVSDGIENCLQYLSNFDPEKSKNPFAYLTQIIYYAFLRRISREKKQAYIKMKVFQNTDKYGEINRMAKNTDFDGPAVDVDNPYAEHFRLSRHDLNYFERKEAAKKLKKSQKAVPKNLENFF